MSQQSLQRVSEKLNELHLSYLEKQRELNVLKSESEIRAESLTRQLDEQRREIEGLRQDRDIFQREANALKQELDALRAGAQSIVPEPELIRQESMLRLESEAQRLRSANEGLTRELEAARLKLSKSHFEIVKLEETLKALQENIVQKSFKLRHFEETLDENKALRDQVTALHDRIEQAPPEQAVLPEEVNQLKVHINNQTALIQQLTKELSVVRGESKGVEPKDQFAYLYRTLVKSRALVNNILDLDQAEELHLGQMRPRQD